MSLTNETAQSLKELLLNTIRNKLRNYKPETFNMPFHYRLLGRDRYEMFSFIQSMNTTFGMSIWEQVAVILARGAGRIAENQYELRGSIDEDTETYIREIHLLLRQGQLVPNKSRETNDIRRKIRPGSQRTDPDSRVDFFTVINGCENYYDITSAKPNMKEFAALKLKLLRWTALRLSIDNNANIFTALAIPYNPYDPNPYERWTLRGLYDLSHGEILVGEEFWNYIAGGDIYNELLNIFQEAGEQLRPEINQRFSEFRTGS